MTLQQLKYVIIIAETGTITEAADRLFLSQPSLTNAVHELEKRWAYGFSTARTRESAYPKKGKIFWGVCKAGIGAGGNS